MEAEVARIDLARQQEITELQRQLNRSRDEVAVLHAELQKSTSR